MRGRDALPLTKPIVSMHWRNKCMKNNIRSKINLLYIKGVYEIIRNPTKNSTETAKCHDGKERRPTFSRQKNVTLSKLSPSSCCCCCGCWWCCDVTDILLSSLMTGDAAATVSWDDWAVSDDWQVDRGSSTSTDCSKHQQSQSPQSHLTSLHSQPLTHTARFGHFSTLPWVHVPLHAQPTASVHQTHKLLMLLSASVITDLFSAPG